MKGWRKTAEESEGKQKEVRERSRDRSKPGKEGDGKERREEERENHGGMERNMEEGKDRERNLLKRERKQEKIW